MPHIQYWHVDKAMKKYNRDIDWRKIMQGPEMDDVDDMRADHYRQQKQTIGESKKWCLIKIRAAGLFNLSKKANEEIH